MAHLEEVYGNCDFDGDKKLDACEIHACLVLSENSFREAKCKDFGKLFCDCPFKVAKCEGSWNCKDIAGITVDILNSLDKNSDGKLNLKDEIDEKHMK